MSVRGAGAPAQDGQHRQLETSHLTNDVEHANGQRATQQKIQCALADVPPLAAPEVVPFQKHAALAAGGARRHRIDERGRRAHAAVGSSRNGAMEFGFWVRSASLSPFTRGVPGAASKRGSPGGLTALGSGREVVIEGVVLVKDDTTCWMGVVVAD